MIANLICPTAVLISLIYATVADYRIIQICGKKIRNCLEIACLQQYIKITVSQSTVQFNSLSTSALDLSLANKIIWRLTAKHK